LRHRIESTPINCFAKDRLRRLLNLAQWRGEVDFQKSNLLLLKTKAVVIDFVVVVVIVMVAVVS